MRNLLTLLLLFLVMFAHAQTINGVVADVTGGSPVSDVAIYNVHTDAGLTTDGSGRFSIAAAAGQLIEFRKIGYKTARLRITSGPAQPFYRIMLEPGVLELDEIEVRNHYRDFKHDSERYRALFKKELEFPKMSTLQAIQSPFSALSKKNRQLWAFQKEYAWFEQQKFVDYAFNEKLINNLTGLRGDSAVQYMRRFRPNYEMVRAMPEYDFFTYVKQTVALWRQRQRTGPGNSRGGGSGG